MPCSFCTGQRGFFSGAPRDWGVGEPLGSHRLWSEEISDCGFTVKWVRQPSQMGCPAVSPPPHPRGCTCAQGRQSIHDSSLLLKFQMHTKKKIRLKMFCFSFPTCFFLPPTLCLKDELSVTFSQSFLLTNLGKVNGSVHAPLCPLSHGISARQGTLVCVKTGHCEVCDSYTLCQRTCDF